jgi:hypothetical protein
MFDIATEAHAPIWGCKARRGLGARVPGENMYGLINGPGNQFTDQIFRIITKRRKVTLKLLFATTFVQSLNKIGQVVLELRLCTFPKFRLSPLPNIW